MVTYKKGGITEASFKEILADLQRMEASGMSQEGLRQALYWRLPRIKEALAIAAVVKEYESQGEHQTYIANGILFGANAILNPNGTSK